jgi:hypothetical protein
MSPIVVLIVAVYVLLESMRIGGGLSHRFVAFASAAGWGLVWRWGAGLDWPDGWLPELLCT